MDMNQVQLVGRLADGVMYTPEENGRSARAVGRVIINRRPSKDGKRRYDAVQVVAWGNTATNMANFTGKGKEVAIIGELRVNNIRPAKEGDAWKNFTEVLIHNISFGRDSNQQKMQKALQSGDAAAAAALAGINFAELFDKNPDILEKVAGIAATLSE